MKQIALLIAATFFLAACTTSGLSTQHRSKNTTSATNKSAVALTVKTNPSGSSVKIMNIKPKYHDGIILSKGKYRLLITKNGYEAYDKWIELERTKILNINLNKVIREKMVSENGAFLWSYKKNEDYLYQPIKNFNNTLVADMSVGGSSRTWYGAQQLCQQLKVKTNGTVISGFKLPNERQLKNIYRYRKNLHNVRYNKARYRVGKIPRTIWSNVSSSFSDGTKVAKSFYLELDSNPRANGSFSGWYRKQGTTFPAICVKNLSKDLKHLSIVQAKYIKAEAAETLASRLTKSEYSKLDQANIGPAPQKPKHKSRPKLTKDEFETTKEFSSRELKSFNKIDRHNKLIDSQYNTEIKSWEKELKKAKLNAQQTKKNFNRKQAYLNNLSKAMTLKYGKPTIKSASYDADNEKFNLTIASSRNSFQSKLAIQTSSKHAKTFKKMLLDKAFNPDVEMSILNGKVHISGIRQLKSPEKLVEHKLLNDAEGSKVKLSLFLEKYPNSELAVLAEIQLKEVIEKEKRKIDNAYNNALSSKSSSKMRSFIRKYPLPEYQKQANLKITEFEQQEKILAEERAIRNKNRIAAENEAERRAYLAEKNIGDKVCMEGSMAFGLINPTISAYVERKNGSKIQIRIANTEGTSPHYNGTSLHNNVLIWDEHYSWRLCN